MKSNFYEGKHVLITGASTGIGRQLTLQLLEKGAIVFAVSRSMAKLEEVVELSRNFSGKIVPFAVDLSTYDNCKKLFDAYYAQFKRLDILINNAGIGHFSGFVDTKRQDYEYVVQTNFMAPLYITQLFFGLLRNGLDPRVVNICSSGAFYGIAFRGVYCASKAGMRAWSQALSLEFRRFGIEVFTVIPGSTKTNFFDNQIGRAPKAHRIPGKIELPQALSARILKSLIGKGRELNCSLPNKLILYLSVLCPALLKMMIQRAIAAEEEHIYRS